MKVGPEIVKHVEEMWKRPTLVYELLMKSCDRHCYTSAQVACLPGHYVE